MCVWYLGEGKFRVECRGGVHAGERSAQKLHASHNRLRLHLAAGGSLGTALYAVVCCSISCVATCNMIYVSMCDVGRDVLVWRCVEPVVWW